MNQSTAILFSIVGVLLGTLSAQNVPLFVNYQGFVTGPSNVPLGATGSAPNFVASPINRKIIFRVYGSQNGPDRVWSEQQTVTISLGEFSVLLGQGIDAVYNSATETPRPSLDTVFTGGPGRYLEILVDDGDGNFTPADLPITPRQRITSTAYSFRSVVADTVPASAINATAIANGAVTAAKIVDSAIGTAKLTDASVTSNKIADLSVATADLANGSVTAAKLGSDVGLWSVNGPNVYRSAGNVGIGTATPVFPLNFAATLGDKISLYGNTLGSSFGLGIQSNLLQIHGNLPGSDIAFGYGSSAAMTETMRIKGNGKVGIGTSTPAYPLSIRPATGDLIELGGWTYGTGGGDHFGLGISGFGHMQIHTPISANDIVFGWGRSAALNETVRFKGDGKVGIGTNAPLAPLHVFGGVANSFNHQFEVNGSVAADRNANVDTLAHSIIAEQRIRASAFDVASDSRIKDNLSPSDSIADLAILMGMEITNYTFRDTLVHGRGSQKKVIAQQVESIYPQAVTKSTCALPDIYQKASFESGWVTLATDLKQGERVRLIGRGIDGVHEVMEVADGKFRVNLATDADQVFVYGREVQDFRTVDYDAIAMLNVSATQQIKREKDAEVTALRDEVGELRARVAELEAKDKARDAKIASIEAHLESIDAPPVRTVSLKTAGGEQ